MDYNTIRNKLIIPEYGRNIQKMVEYALTVEEREKRTKIAYLITSVMSQLAPGYKDTIEFRHKMWDHLHIISDYRLDVDAPFPAPAREDVMAKPGRLKYPYKVIKYPHYGNNIKLLIEKAIEQEEGPAKDAFVKSIANHMKKLYLTWNRESVEDDVISKNLSELSQGTLKLSEDVRLNHTRDILSSTAPRKKKFVPKPDNRKNYKNKKFKRDYNR
jgi:hypothetical protein